MKERYGVDPQFPISRYVGGFTNAKVPNRAGEHTVTVAGSRRVISDYLGTPTCTNPIFAASLPGSAGEELCALPQGSRSRELVVFAVLGGVPEQLVSDTPNWEAILGRNPGAYDLTGIDPHMFPSVTPRAGLAAPSSAPGDNGTDPVHGREWDTDGSDLQYACTFTLPAPRQCADNDLACDCPPDRTTNPPICGVTPGQQLKAKAYPTTRPLRVAQGLGQRGVIGSICAGDGYDATMQRLAKRLASRLAR